MRPSWTSRRTRWPGRRRAQSRPWCPALSTGPRSGKSPSPRRWRCKQALPHRPRPCPAHQRRPQRHRGWGQAAPRCGPPRRQRQGRQHGWGRAAPLRHPAPRRLRWQHQGWGRPAPGRRARMRLPQGCSATLRALEPGRAPPPADQGRGPPDGQRRRCPWPRESPRRRAAHISLGTLADAARYAGPGRSGSYPSGLGAEPASRESLAR
mmetsp:Transcript_72159/g.228054  ORF Transcript_72159/g.228054 Transcript_72159/m.228054 type:complete len:208 (+) Transcript_72159:415-1038(+)